MADDPRRHEQAPAPPGWTIRLDGRVALVTGSGRNIGRAMILAYARAGADVVIHAGSRRDEVEAVAAEARALGVRALAAVGDVRDSAAVEQIVAEARECLGPIDILVNSAAIRHESPFEALSPERWHEALSIILDGAYVCTRAVIGGMLERGRGTIVNVIGMSSQAGAAERAHIITAKSGLIGFTKALATEYGGRGITVNGVSPGMIATERRGDTATVAPAHHERRVIPVGRRGDPDEVAAACCFLASDEARFITGQIIAVNGGAYL